jgi:hypothetical protein
LVRRFRWVGLLTGLVFQVVLAAADVVLESGSEDLLAFRILPSSPQDMVISGKWLAGHGVLFGEPDVLPGWLSVAASVFDDETVDTRDHLEQAIFLFFVCFFTSTVVTDSLEERFHLMILYPVYFHLILKSTRSYPVSCGSFPFSSW